MIKLINFDGEEIIYDVKMKVFYELYSNHEYEAWSFGEKISNERLKLLTGLTSKQWITKIDTNDYQLFETLVDVINDYFEAHGSNFTVHQPTLIWWLINHRMEYNRYSNGFKNYVKSEREFMDSWTRGKGCKPEPCYLNNECYDFYDIHNCYNPNSYDTLIAYLDMLS